MKGPPPGPNKHLISPFRCRVPYTAQMSLQAASHPLGPFLCVAVHRITFTAEGVIMVLSSLVNQEMH